jgi:methionyl-tRNA formyltransferase
MSKMRIVLIGQAAFGAEVLKRLVQNGEEIAAVFCPTGKAGDMVKETADKLSVIAHQVPSLKSSIIFPEVRHLAPDLGVMAFVTDRISGSVLTMPVKGTIQYHPSLLPLHRGGSAINWAIIKGETRTGISIFWPDEGYDTGPILMQKEAEISPTDTVGSLYFNKLFPLGVEAMIESVELIKQGKAPREPQDEIEATYEGLCTEKE